MGAAWAGHAMCESVLFHQTKSAFDYHHHHNHTIIKPINISVNLPVEFEVKTL
jgi:hypothetical protein